METMKATVIKAKSAKGKRFLKAREAKQEEKVKNALLLGGHNVSQTGRAVLRDLQKLKYLECVILSKRHVGMAPFEDGGEVEMEKLSKKYDCGLFVVANHTKSKPDNLVFGRFYDHRIYDMIEAGVSRFDPMESFEAASVCPIGLKPCFVFVGDKFETEPKLKQLKNVFLDFFRGEQIESIRFDGLQRVIVLTAVDQDRVLFRQYKVSPRTLAASTKVGDGWIELGPRLDLAVRRSREPPMELSTAAAKKTPTKRKLKNVKLDSLENKVGSVYVPTQDIDKIVTARPKGTKRQRRQSQNGNKASD